MTHVLLLYRHMHAYLNQYTNIVQASLFVKHSHILHGSTELKKRLKQIISFHNSNICFYGIFYILHKITIFTGTSHCSAVTVMPTVVIVLATVDYFHFEYMHFSINRFYC